MNLHSLLAAIAAIFAFQSPAIATSFAIQKFSSFVNEAPFIVRGEIHNIFVDNGITNDGQKTLYTFATLEIKEVLKGPLDATEIKIRKAGGTKDGFTLEVPGSPEFATGEDAVLFLGQPQEDQSYEIVSMELGKFDIEATGNDFKLTGGLLGYSLQSKPGQNASATDHEIFAENSKIWTLSQLRDLIRGEVSIGSTTNNPTTEAPSAATALESSSPSQSEAPAASAVESPERAKQASATSRYVVGALIALGIFFFFKKRG